MNTVNSFQYHRLSFQGSTIHHSFPPQTVWKSAKCEYERSRYDGWYKQFSKCLQTELPRRRQSRMTLHRRRIQAMTSLTLATSVQLQTTASLKPSEWTVISLPSHRRDTSVHTKRPKSPLVRRECQWSLLHSV